jgi:hypothetical protein
MRGKRGKTSFAASAAALLALALACGEPLGPLEARWVHVADFPPDVRSINGISAYLSGEEGKEEVGVYAAVERVGAYDALVRCSRYGYAVEFDMNERYGGGSLADVAGYGGCLWASGAKSSAKTTVPFISRKPFGGEWEEVPVPYRPGAAASAVVPLNDADCWFLVDDHYRQGEHRGTLAKYDRGAVTTYENLGEVTVALSLDPGRRGYAAPPRLYAVTSGGAPVKVFITEDAGASWAEETLPPDVVPGFHLSTATAAATAGRDLYIIANLGYEGEAGNYSAVVKRAGPPGGGEYEAAFIGREGPYFKDLTGLAFLHPGYRDYGLGVGTDTTLLFDEGSVYFERLPYGIEFAEVVVSKSHADGFFAVGNNSAFGGWELMYHP